MIEKHIKNATTALSFIFLTISLLLADLWVLPQKTLGDEIVAYRVIYTGKGATKSLKTVEGYHYYTQKNHPFSTEKAFVEESDITLSLTPIFSFITQVKTDKKDYSDLLISDLNGIVFMLLFLLYLSSIIGLLYLKWDKNMTKNRFYNILLINGFMLIITFFMHLTYN
ncbi:hypothetical protein [Flavobacterium sp. JP2137]|uniref:hypothetical protein n=1 Tax=Flavobacterium sp. JP2137 TaxID=3414510 RepID=UPI003D2FB6D7